MFTVHILKRWFEYKKYGKNWGYFKNVEKNNNDDNLLVNKKSKFNNNNNIVSDTIFNCKKLKLIIKIWIINFVLKEE